MARISVNDIEAAAAALTGFIPVTPAIPSTFLSEKLGCRLTLKLENLHHTGSFKERGALNKLRSLSDDAKARGVIAASAGNHAQGVAHHATRLGIPATIVMPQTTPFTKVSRTEGFGGRVVLTGESLNDSQAHAERLATEQGLTMIHPYDDAAIIIGQGTIGLELLAAVPDLDDIVVPIGGGGIISGIAIAAKALKPDIRITGVEAAMYPSMSDALKGITRNYGGPTLAEGIAVKTPGVLTREIIAELVDDIILADEPMLEEAARVLLVSQRLLAEGAGAAGVAAVMLQPQRFSGRRVGVVITGGNVDARLVSSILMRGLVHDGQLTEFIVQVDDTPGLLSRVTAIVGQFGGNILEVEHNRLVLNVPVKRADIDLLIETRNRDHAEVIRERLVNAGFVVTIGSALGVAPPSHPA
jgi:threonine dehydratase